MKTFKRVVDSSRYDADWSRRSKIFLRQNPVCHCDEVKAWNGSMMITFAADKPGTFRPARLTDHVRPLSAGGLDEPENYQGLCYRCHAIKTRRYG